MTFSVSLLIRSFAWIMLLQSNGVVNRVLMFLGVIRSPLDLIYNSTGVIIGMTHILLPYMVLPAYAVMSRIDLSLTDAAGILGASPGRAFRRVFLPLSLPGLYAGALLVFVLALGFYITPALLGGAGNELIGQVIADQAIQQGQLGFSSAIGVVLLVLTILVLGAGTWLLRRSGAIREVGADL